MKWEKWVKRELRLYACRVVDIEYFEHQLERIDYDIQYPTSVIDGLPKAPGVSRTSTTERQVLNRERTRLFWLRRIEQVQSRVNVVEKALGGLSEVQRKIIEKCYFSLSLSDSDIAKGLGITLYEFKKQKELAISQLFDSIIGGYRQLFFSTRLVQAQ